MKNIFTPLCIAILLLGFNGCSNNPADPGDDEENLQQGRRDYTWTIDTIKAQSSHSYSMWGFAANNLYVAGLNGGGQIFRFNGSKWNAEPGVTINNPVDFVGLGNKMWICGKQGDIWCYSGTGYQKEFECAPAVTGPVNMYDMDGRSENEIFACAGRSNQFQPNGLVFKYDGTTWSLFKIFENSGVFTSLKYSSKNDKYYFKSSLQNNFGVSIDRVYEFDRNEIKLIKEHEARGDNRTTVNTINGYVYITVGNKLYRYINDNMELLYEITDSNFIDPLGGRNKKDIFFGMTDGIAHYNGTDFQYLLKVQENVWINNKAMVFEKDIFIPVQDFNSGSLLIYHGVVN